MNIVEAVPPVQPDVWDAARRILEASFPPEEIGSVDDIYKQVSEGLRRLWVNEALTAVAVTCDLGTPKCDVLLEFLAVRPDVRSCGLGARLLKDLLVRIPGPIVLEVENPDVAPTAEARRRISFYERLGGSVLHQGRDYAMPNLATSGIVPMWLIEMDTDRAGELVDGELLNLVTAIWTRAYSRGQTDPDFANVLDRMATGRGAYGLGCVADDRRSC